MTEYSYDAITRKRLRFLSWLFRFWVVVALLSALIWGWTMVRDPKFLPIKRVKIMASFQHVDRKSLEAAVIPFVPAGLLSVNLTGIQQQLRQIAWVNQVSLKRVWPDQLLVKVTEQQPVAVWNSTGLLNAAAGVFSPPLASFPARLPVLLGPDGQQSLMLEQYQRLSAQLLALHLTIIQLSLDQRRSWQMVLSNGMVLVLGKETPFVRFNRFITIYPKLFANASKKALRVDMRYADGFAVEWQKAENIVSNNTISTANPSQQTNLSVPVTTAKH